MIEEKKSVIKSLDDIHRLFKYLHFVYVCITIKKQQNWNVCLGLSMHDYTFDVLNWILFSFPFKLFQLNIQFCVLKKSKKMINKMFLCPQEFKIYFFILSWRMIFFILWFQLVVNRLLHYTKMPNYAWNLSRIGF